MIVTNHSYSPFFSFASKTSGIIPAEIQPVSGHWDNNKKLKMKLTPPPSLPHLLPLLPESPFTSCGRGRWAKGGCGKSTGTALYAWRDSHFIQSADERTAATVTGCRSLVKRRRERVCVHDRGKDWVRFHQCMLIGRAYSAKPHGTGSLVIFLQA